MQLWRHNYWLDHVMTFMTSPSNSLAWWHFVVVSDTTARLLIYWLPFPIIYCRNMLPLEDPVRASPPSLFTCALKVAMERRLRKVPAANGDVVDGKQMARGRLNWKWKPNLKSKKQCIWSLDLQLWGSLLLLFTCFMVSSSQKLKKTQQNVSFNRDY